MEEERIEAEKKRVSLIEALNGDMFVQIHSQDASDLETLAFLDLIIILSFFYYSNYVFLLYLIEHFSKTTLHYSCINPMPLTSSSGWGQVSLM